MDALEPPTSRRKVVENLGMDVHKSKTRNPIVFCKWCQQLLKSYLEREPAPMQNSMSHRGETKDVTANELVQRNNHRSKDEKSSIVGSIVISSRKQRFKSLKCDSTEHSVRKCPACALGEAERLLKQRNSYTKGKVKKAVALGSSGEVMMTVDGIENVNTLLDSGSDYRMISVGLVKVLPATKYLPIKDLKVPLKIATVGKTPLWVKRSVLLAYVELTTNDGLLVWCNLEVMVNEEDESISLLMDENFMEIMGYSVETILQRASEKQAI
uniref:AlNc14C455G11756 protein n=1 Tax=Albugo laibachii Nc14 TaxID=890382 RepID=F0X014_9STRA|nr:AlNc14C455G11756 [Albugo laibachii Nc14]|eukprot:CCA27096.1 AlNc14C455G11756 [Albugo laibachii Nc14]